MHCPDKIHYLDVRSQTNGGGGGVQIVGGGGGVQQDDQFLRDSMENRPYLIFTVRVGSTENLSRPIVSTNFHRWAKDRLGRPAAQISAEHRFHMYPQNCSLAEYGDVESMIGCLSRTRLVIGVPFLRSPTILKCFDILSAKILESVKNLRILWYLIYL